MKKQRPYITKQIVASVFLALILCWFTISLPFIYLAKQITQKQQSSSLVEDSRENNSSNPINGASEEKTGGGMNTIAEEYIYATVQLFHGCDININRLFYPCAESVYTAFHGELLCPPPNRCA